LSIAENTFICAAERRPDRLNLFYLFFQTVILPVKDNGNADCRFEPLASFLKLHAGMKLKYFYKQPEKQFFTQAR